MDVLFYPSGYAQSHIRALEEIADIIKSVTYRDLVEQIRSTADVHAKDILKAKLPNFSPSLSSGNRKLEAGTTATGIMQFDYDDANADYDALKAKALAMPHLAYAYFSASRKLKIGIQTDFQFGEADCVEVNKKRFKAAHKLATREVANYIDLPFDPMSNVPSQLSAVSYDPDAYFNFRYAPLALDELCHAEIEPVRPTEPSIELDLAIELLRWIPKRLPYKERFHINTAILGAIGERAIPILEQHWHVDNPQKLLRDLRDQLETADANYFGYAVKVARENGWPGLSGKKHWRQKALPSQHIFPLKMTAVEALPLVEEHLQRFKSGASTILRLPCGFGKTKQVLDFVAELGWQKKVLILVPNHKNGDELERRLNDALRNRARKFPREPRVRAVHIRGRNELCEQKDTFEKYTGTNPADVCFKKCMYQGECSYSLQFDGLDNIRIVYAADYYNQESAMWHGTCVVDGTKSLKRDGWNPDFVIMDEGSIELLSERITKDSGWSSLSKIIEKCGDGTSVADAIRQHAALVKDDIRKRVISAKQPDYEPRRGEAILDTIQRYFKSEISRDWLSKVLRFENSSLSLDMLRPAAERYRSTPTLVLDATINKEIANIAFPGFDFVDIPVKTSGKVRIFQAQNVNITKRYLADQTTRGRALKNLRAVADRYIREGKTVGLITYLSVKGFDCDGPFDRWLAHQIGAKVYQHFGNLRGTNDFEDVDCLIIFGRHAIPSADLLSKAKAVFGGEIKTEAENQDVPILMQDGNAMTLENLAFKDERLSIAYEQWCKSETKQAVGRGRPVHGKPKDIFLFSNESLGSDVEVAGFFDFDHGDFTDKIEIPDETRCFRYKPSELKKLGFTEHYTKNYPEMVEEKLLTSGFSIYEVQYKDRHSRNWTHTFIARKETDLVTTINGTIKGIALLKLAVGNGSGPNWVSNLQA